MLPPDIAKLLPKNRLLSEVFILLLLFTYICIGYELNFSCADYQQFYCQAFVACTSALHTSSAIAQL